MNHKVGFNKLNRTPAHRKALIRNMMTSLFQHERITTTRAKAIEVRRFAEKEITRAKVDSVHNRRMVARKLWDKDVSVKLFTDIAPRFKDRNGGYTRILRLGTRKVDAADMVILELVDYQLDSGLVEEKATRKAQKKEKLLVEEKEAEAASSK